MNLRSPDWRAGSVPTELTSSILAVSQYLCSGAPVRSHETIYCPLARDHAQVTIHSKNSRVRFDLEKSPRGPDPFWGQTYPESRSDWPGIRVRLTRNPSQKDILDSDSGHFYPDSRSVWPRNGSDPMGPFSGSNLTREFLEYTTWEEAVRGCTIKGYDILFYKYHVMNHKGNWLGTFLDKFWMNKDKFTRAGFEPVWYIQEIHQFLRDEYYRLQMLWIFQPSL